MTLMPLFFFYLEALKKICCSFCFPYKTIFIVNPLYVLEPPGHFVKMVSEWESVLFFFSITENSSSFQFQNNLTVSRHRYKYNNWIAIGQNNFVMHIYM